MSVEERLAALEKRVRVAEDQLEIIRLLNTYGPAVDSGEGEAAAHLWIEGGVYDMGGLRRAKGFDDIAEVYVSQIHQDMIHKGCAHLTATPRITMNGDTAEAVAYSFIVLKGGEGWNVFRASVNHWTLTRTHDGWRIVERYNRTVDGSEESHDTMRKVLR
ncbi:MAG: nuclear transport factor 2 family protein [Rhodospirillaceae bacterium]|nr:MAG: nuclear transport factor 2 family protein [Rhodospirillaceae bacterium]